MGNRKEKLQIGVKSGDQNMAVWVLAWSACEVIMLDLKKKKKKRVRSSKFLKIRNWKINK